MLVAIQTINVSYKPGEPMPKTSTGKTLLFMLLLALLAPVLARAQDAGGIWLVSYYATPNLSGGVVATETSPTLNLNFSADRTLLPPGLDIEGFSLRAQTQPRLQAGTYEFRAGSSDGIRVYVDGELLIDSFVEREFAPNQDTASISLTEGIHAISVEYFNAGGDARLEVSWQRVSELATAVSGPALPQVQVGTGQVFNVEGLSVRTGPYLGASRVEIIEPGTSFPVFARNTQEGQFTWYLIAAREVIEVDDDTTGQEIVAPVGDPVIGWVSGRYFLIDVPDEQVPLVDSVFESLATPPSTGVQGVSRSNLRLRQFPSYRTPTLIVLDWGADFEILSRTIQENDNFWYQVNYEGQIGWVYAPYVSVVGDIDLVPDY